MRFFAPIPITFFKRDPEFESFSSERFSHRGGSNLRSHFAFLKSQTYRIDTITDAALGFWAVRESVAEVAAAIGTEDFFPNHKMGIIHVDINGVRFDRFGEGRPSATTVILSEE